MPCGECPNRNFRILFHRQSVCADVTSPSDSRLHSHPFLLSGELQDEIEQVANQLKGRGIYGVEGQVLTASVAALLSRGNPIFLANQRASPPLRLPRQMPPACPAEFHVRCYSKLTIIIAAEVTRFQQVERQPRPNQNAGCLGLGFRRLEITLPTCRRDECIAQSSNEPNHPPVEPADVASSSNDGFSRLLGSTTKQSTTKRLRPCAAIAPASRIFLSSILLSFCTSPALRALLWESSTEIATRTGSVRHVAYCHC